MDIAASAHAPFIPGPGVELMNATLYQRPNLMPAESSGGSLRNKDFSGILGNGSYNNVMLEVTSVLEATTTLPDSFNVSSNMYKKTKKRRKSRRQPSPMQVFLLNLDNIVIPIALSLGILGSILLVLVFMCTPLKASALSHYLTALGISDCIYSVSCLIVWTSSRGITFYETIGVCQITHFALLLSRFLATWYLFAAHAERFVVHFGSNKARKWCSTFRTKCIIICIFVFSMVGFLHYIWTHVITIKDGMPRCVIMDESVPHILELQKIEIISAIFLPMFLIVIIDVAFCVKAVSKYCKRFFSKKNRTQTQRSGDSSRGAYTLAKVNVDSRSPSNRSGDSTPPPPEFDISREKRQATLLLIITGAVFIALVLPSSIYRAKNSFSTTRQRPAEGEMLRMILFEQMVKFNSMYKVFLYLALLKSFRNGLVYFFKSGFQHKRQEEPLEETTTV